MKKGITITTVITAILLFMSVPVFAGSSVVSMHVAGSITINGQAAVIGDEVAVFDQAGNQVGAFIVDQGGIYGDMAISGDFASSSEDEGAAEGEVLSVNVLQAATGTTYSGDGVSLKAPAEGNTIYSPYTNSVLQFEGGGFYLLDIQAN